ncbi:hypothetical protein HMPREF0591_4495 [Mycobacterium parascrofulaceum ATCC BAA-614]|uniref:Uncharacterized protein n=1 Tax=Mycobacterium parascrofulaceum ATCC BAA-614 TaxID=525368 RepID=D5PEA1_9MYCO|nr:hypothetical protein HMPREF0591_4495 [Mycobacterium parascrofulaceum ATCC BAA-614]ETZ40325.1 putative alpha amylase [Mycobacterium intracellulare MIN_052511_1280]ETZ51947.1 putative alpha amylase [Mycobacterium avium MAV_120809_2495]
MLGDWDRSPESRTSWPGDRSSAGMTVGCRTRLAPEAATHDAEHEVLVRAPSRKVRD